MAMVCYGIDPIFNEYLLQRFDEDLAFLEATFMFHSYHVLPEGTSYVAVGPRYQLIPWQ